MTIMILGKKGVPTHFRVLCHHLDLEIASRLHENESNSIRY